MDSLFFFSFFAVAVSFFTPLCIIFFLLHKKFRFHQQNKTLIASSSSTSSVISPSLSRNWKHHVFPSFHGEDVRRTFLTHILKEFRRKGIDPFIDNDIERSKSIGPELIEAIKESRVAIVLLSKNYASSSWCLNELVEIMKCRKEFGQIVMTIFYDVTPTHVKKQTGDFGKVFTKTCKGKTKEEIKRWRTVLEAVSKIAGEDSRNWDNEAAMIEKIATNVSNVLNNSTPSRDFDGLIGMGARMKEMEPLLCLESDEVRMIGIWGPSGIGKTTIARFLFNQISKSFQLSVFMENIKEFMYTRPLCTDDYNTKLQLQKQFMSQIVNHKDIEIPHLGVVQDRLNNKKVLIVLDNIDQSIQLDALAKDTRWFGHGSRIVITTQDQKLLKAHGINHIYKVGFPSTSEACQIFCMYAFEKKFPKEGFEKLASEVTKLVGGLPLGLRVMGSHFRGMSKHEWIIALPRLKTRLDASIQSILKFSYDALCDEDKNLFLHIACLFNHKRVEKVVEHLAHDDFLDVRQGLHILTEKSLISIEEGRIKMHNLLEQLGKEIVRHELGPQSIHECGKRQFLVNTKDICEVLTDDTGSKSVIGLHFYPSELSGELNLSERAFEGMSNLKFLRFYYRRGDQSDKLCLPQGLNCLSRKLRILEWDRFPMTCLPSNFRTECLVELNLRFSKLHKLWEGNQPLGNLKWMYLNHSKNLKELPDLTTATKLEELFLVGCSSLVELPSSIGSVVKLQRLYLSDCSRLVELPSSIGNAINLVWLNLIGCSSLVKLPSSIGNATNLQGLYLDMCTGLVELPSSIGNLHKLQTLTLLGCSKLEALPTNINLKSLDTLDLTDCLLLKSFPEISTNIMDLRLMGSAIKNMPSSIKLWSRLLDLEMSYNENLKDCPHALERVTELHLSDTNIQNLPSWFSSFTRLDRLVLKECKKVVSLPQLSDSLSYLKAVNCESLERLDCSFHNPNICLCFVNCFKLNKEARELIIKTSTNRVVLPGGEVPAHFTYRATSGSSLTIRLNERHLPTSMRFKACILLFDKSVKEKKVEEVYDRKAMKVSYRIMDRGVIVPCRPTHYYLAPPLKEHLYSFEFEVDVTSNELFFDFQVDRNEAVIKECGVVLQL
ncbi:PREDICTED: probable disease resistance protein RPP1 [Camelina sativa]|uniref:ADP-ribosyl cyclase/cyclic ADP-ribose hydrolase n=1 Tax=Camelina sativa TaxID=90675 RepID=A0ABM0W057_CAMSA|nr:PREDICTED: probable disease resistance protein RPP1 [Camelina sativa]